MTRSVGNGHGFMGLEGELARRIATHDWASTPIGPIEGWPVSLRHTVAMMLPSRVPLVLLWGPMGVMLYNDAYAEFAGGRDSGYLARTCSTVGRKSRNSMPTS
ncbi:hypothetical protein ACFSLT_00870 [Novosphingobium resinovorum]